MTKLSHIKHRGVFWRRWLLAVGLALLTVSLGVACGPDEISNKQATELVDQWDDVVGESLGSLPGGTGNLKKQLQEAAEADRQKIERTEPPYDTLVGEAYDEVGYDFHLTQSPGADADGVLTARGDAVWQALNNLERHAIPVDSFERQAIREAIEFIEARREKIADARAVSLTDRERQAAIDWLTGKVRADLTDTSGNTTSADESTADESTSGDVPSSHTILDAWLEESAASRLASKRETIEAAGEEIRDQRVELERLLARNAARYARKMKHDQIREPYVHPRHDDYWTDPITDGQRPDDKKGEYRAGQVWRTAVKIAESSADEAEVLSRRIRETVVSILKADSGEAAGKVLDELQPNHPQYAGLVDAYDQYRSYVADGGWEKVPVTSGLGPGVEHERVKDLKRRLQREGYYPSDASLDAAYGEKLEQAVRSYQQTHQMEVTGEPHSMFWTSLNASAEERARQIALNLQRWRDSKVDHDEPLYVMVNIPDFHVEVWKNQERAMRFPTVVGNHDAKRQKPTNDQGEVIENAPKEVVYPNNTPVFSAYIDRVIYNPYWNVTDRIREEEVLPKVRESVVSTYKGKLKSLKRKAVEQRENQTEDNKEDGAGFFRSLTATTDREETDASNGDESSEQSDNTERASSDDETSDTEDRIERNRESSALQSADQLPGMGDESSSDEESGDGASGEDSSDDVDISELFTEKTVTVDEARDIEEKRVVFDVKAVRSLLQDVHGAESSGGNGKSEKSTSQTGQQKTDDAEQGDDASLIAQHFPYLNTKKGWVDVSSTDPDHVPSWYAENYYEVVFPGKKWEYVRVIPGTHNALGRVKVIFPNQHSVYLHDTPKKHLFSRTLRAFSHGCLRMEKPLQFAEFLLRQDGLYEDQNVDTLLRGERVAWSKFKKENNFKTDDPTEVIPQNRLVKTDSGYLVIDYEYRPIFLENRVPVHIQYFTVRVDDEGRPHFLADIYDKDEEALKDEG